MSAIYKVLSGRATKAETEKKSHINRQRVLLISSRGITYRHRYLINDLYSLLPHSRKEPKLDTKKQLSQLNEIAELYNCNNVLYFEVRKHTDLYMWLSKPPNGPTIKFYVQNIHNTEELNFTGNCLKGSRPLLSFDAAFDDEAQFKLMKEMFIHTFGVPPSSRKVKPFIDHVMSFSIVDGKVWVRNYQILEQAEDVKNRDDEDVSLVEIGPRFVLTPIVILEGSFGGPKIYENKQYVSPNFVRSQAKQKQADEARARHDAADALKMKKIENVLAVDPLSNEALFKSA